MLPLFVGSSPRVRTIPAGEPALSIVCDGLTVDADPFVLADTLVLVPNRRAAQALQAALAERLGAGFLPAVRPLGDLDDLAETWAPGGLDALMPPAIDPLRRRLELAALVRARASAEGGTNDPVRALAAADALAALLDAEAAGDPVEWSRAAALVPDLDLAEHWARSAAFLAIIGEYWPARLRADGLVDPAWRRSSLIRALAERWRRAPPRGRVLIAGSTGSVAAVRALMAVVAQLDQGCVILPGLDRALDDEAWAALGPGHPQAMLKATLAALGVRREDVVPLGDEAPAAPRRVVLREALAPAEMTADWLARLDRAGGPALLRQGLAGLTLIEADTQEEEAMVAALALRRALERPGVRAALVTADADLARRVAAKLGRWGLVIAPSAAGPLVETPIGALLLTLLDLAKDPAAPVPLAALLRHPLGRLRAPALFAGGRDAIGLRGPRRHGDLADLASKAAPEAESALALLRTALEPLAQAFASPLDLAAAARALAIAAEAVSPDPWAGQSGASALSALEAVAAHGDGMGELGGDGAMRALRRLLEAETAPPEHPPHPRLAIWGPLEARLQQVDVLVLGGLNEGVWPAPPPADPFLTAGMRRALGLPDPETRLGLAAHDFAQLAACRETLLLRAKRASAGPTVASRWLWRLLTLAQGAGGRASLDPSPEDDLLAIARALDAPVALTPAPMCRPRPPAAARPDALAVTDIETLIRDPYALYAKRVLGLRPADPVGAPVGARERGTAIHRAVETFARGADPSAERLAALLRAALAEAGCPPEIVMTDMARLARACAAFARWAAERRRLGWTAEVEAAGEIEVAGVRLRARADRLEHSGEAIAVFDLKTGLDPTLSQVRSGLAPQLPLEAAMAMEGAFGIAAARPVELGIWRFVGRDPKLQPILFEGQSIEEAAIDARARLAALLARYRRPEQPYLSKPRALFAKPYADYDLLARRAEWAEAEGDE